MFWPAATAPVGPVLVTTRSAEVATPDVTTVAVLLAVFVSVLGLVAVAVLVIVPVVAAGTVTTNWKRSSSPGGRVAAVAVLPATANVVAPLVLANDTSVVPAGVASVRLTLWALDGPALVSVIV